MINPILIFGNFLEKIGKIDVLIDDGSHTNLQQVTTLMESIKYIKSGGMIVIEDTHTSYMRDKGFKKPIQIFIYKFFHYL